MSSTVTNNCFSYIPREGNNKDIALFYYVGRCPRPKEQFERSSRWPDYLELFTYPRYRSSLGPSIIKISKAMLSTPVYMDHSQGDLQDCRLITLLRLWLNSSLVSSIDSRSNLRVHAVPVGLGHSRGLPYLLRMFTRIQR